MREDLFPIEFSAVVVMFNEERRLFECLTSLKACREIIAIDLGSSDRCKEIAERAGAIVLTHPRVEIGERARQLGYDTSTNDWIFIVDPDEVIDSETFELARKAIRSDPELAAIHLPMQNYFLGKPIRETVWGLRGKSPSIVHRKRIHRVTQVHDSCYALPGYHAATLETPRILLRHYWVESLSAMIEKHLRYIRLEGEARSLKGERFTVRHTCRKLRYSFLQNFVDLNGWKGGWRGWFLSFFHVCYTLGAMLSLRRFERRLKRCTSSSQLSSRGGESHGSQVDYPQDSHA